MKNKHMFFLFLCGFLFLATAYAVYLGGKTLNDHIVVVFVGGCMAPYVLTGSVTGHFIWILGPIGISALFWVLVLKKEASSWMMPLVYLSQLSYSFAFWWYR